MKYIPLLLLFCSIAFGEPVCIVYFSGIGCPNCAVTDPYLLEELVPEYNGSLVVIEYEVYWNREANAPVLAHYAKNYGIMNAVPVAVFSKNDYSIGRMEVLEIKEKIDGYSEGNPCPLPDGSSVSYDDLDLSKLPGKSVIYIGDEKIESIGPAVGYPSKISGNNILGLTAIFLIILILLMIKKRKRVVIKVGNKKF